jgi:SAM-dependent methyltransferase
MSVAADGDDAMRVYHSYLLRRSRLGALYRQHLLYPTLTRQLRGRVLDVGCGIGDFLRFRPDSVGVDINPHNVDYCRRTGLEAHTASNSLPFANETFDGVMLDNVLEHIVQPETMLAEIRRVLKPGGIFIVGVPGRKGYESDPDHKRFYAATDLETVVNAAGFRYRRLLRMPLPLPFLDRILAQYCLYGIFAKTPQH